MKTNIKMDFCIETRIFNITKERETIELVFNEESIMKILFRFASSTPFEIYTSDYRRKFNLILGIDNVELTHIILQEIKDNEENNILNNYFVDNYPDFIMDLIEAFIEIHSIGKYATLIASTIKPNNSEDNNTSTEEIDYNKVPDEFELPNITDIESKSNNDIDMDFYNEEDDKEYTDYDNKLTDYSESNDF